MKIKMKTTLYIMAILVILMACEAQQAADIDTTPDYAVSEMIAKLPSNLNWNDLGLIPEVQIAILSGDPSKEGHYVLRLKFPPETRMPAHWHPKVEYATIISGRLNLGMGIEEYADSMKVFTAGSFFVVPPEMSHYGRSQDEVIIELSGPGPYEVVFVDDNDDPRI